MRGSRSFDKFSCLWFETFQFFVQIGICPSNAEKAPEDIKTDSVFAEDIGTVEQNLGADKQGSRTGKKIHFVNFWQRVGSSRSFVE